MSDMKLIKKLLSLGRNGDDEALRDAFPLIKELEEEGSAIVNDHLIYDKENLSDAHALSKEMRSIAAKLLKSSGNDRLVELYRESLFFDGPHDFDSFCLGLEWERPRDKKFYEPRRKQLKPVAEALQELETGDLELLGISMPPGVGKTTLALFYLAWIGGRQPELSILGGSHSNSFLEGVYNEMLRILGRTSDEYCYDKIFPVKVVSSNARGLRIDLDQRKRFETYEFNSIGSASAGKVRASHLLYCDDLVSDIEQAMSRDRMDKLWTVLHGFKAKKDRNVQGITHRYKVERTRCSWKIGNGIFQRPEIEIYPDARAKRGRRKQF